jgi:hypothetical protein
MYLRVCKKKNYGKKFNFYILEVNEERSRIQS